MPSSATKQDIRPFVRAFWKEQQRFPTTDETLDWLKANSRYSGEWEDGESKRAKRVGQILAYTEQSFDPKKMSQGEHPPVSLQMGRFSWWVRQHIGSVLTGHIANLRAFDPVAMTAPGPPSPYQPSSSRHFWWSQISVFSKIRWTTKRFPPTGSKSCGRWWTGGAAWNQQYFQIVRERLDRMGVIRIFDRQHHSGKAWRWEAGDSFPADDYRKEQRKLRERSRLRTGVAGSYRDLVAGMKLLGNLTYIIPCITTLTKFRVFRRKWLRDGLLRDGRSSDRTIFSQKL